jgi:formylglycine-generating enzyme required for sulfatase activity
MAFYFCESCGRRITAIDLEEGRARNKQVKGVYCTDCATGVNTITFDAITLDEAMTMRAELAANKTPATAGALAAQYSARARHKPPAPELKRKPPVRLFYVAAALLGVLLAGLVVAFWSGRRGSDPAPPSEPRQVASVPTAPAAPPSSIVTAASSPANPAARQLAKIRAMITPDLQTYAEVRPLLDQFPRSFPGTPEAVNAKALLSEIDTAHAKLAEEALSGARTVASSGKFDEAESALRSVESRFGKGAWFESKGRTAVAEALADIATQRAARALQDVAATLGKAREELRAGRFEDASRFIAERAKWPAELRTQADRLAAEIEGKLAAAAAARKLEEEREAVLAEFDQLMIAGKYAVARDYAKSKAGAGGPLVELLRGGERLAGKLTDEPAARVRGANTLLGREVRLKLTNGHKDAIIKAVTDSGLSLGITFKINNETRESPLELKWDALHQDQKAEFARLGGFEMSAGDAAIMAAYAALASNDLGAAGKAVGGGSGSPLGVHLAAVVAARAKQFAYESAMRRAEDLVAAKKLKDAEGECAKALEAKPGDEKATALLAEVRRLSAAPQTLTLDLGNGVNIEFVYIKPGSFIMGGDQTSDSKFVGSNTPKHPVTITKGYYLGKYEVTQAQYQAIMGKDPSRNAKGPNQPADSMGWGGANEFCKKASEKTGRQVRLPTEAEWEFACRAGSDADWGLGADTSETGNAHTGAPPVGQKKPNAWGLYDMHGGVSEYAADLYDPGYYASSPKEDPKGPNVKAIAGSMGTTATVLLRGGSCSARLRAAGYGFYPNWGFRVAVTATGDDTGTSTTPAVSK